MPVTACTNCACGAVEHRCSFGGGAIIVAKRGFGLRCFSRHGRVGVALLSLLAVFEKSWGGWVV